MKVLIAGDICQRYRVDTAFIESKYHNLFNGIRPIIQDSDYSIVNFEFPIVLKEGNPIPKCGPNLKGSIHSIEALKYVGFNVCTLANNHIMDQGSQCCLDTKHFLNSAKIETVGVGRNLDEASEILYLKKDGETLAVINCCEHEFSLATDDSAGAYPLNPIKQYHQICEAKKNADYVIVIVHGGPEYYQYPTPRMKELYHFFVDVGANAVINHHQHCYSGMEEYCGVPIYYGLGNFCFDEPSQRNSIWNKGVLASIQFEKDNPCKYTIIPYIQCDDNLEIKLLVGEELDKFNMNFYELSKIISSDKQLSDCYIRWQEKTIKEFELIFEPYSNRLTMGLYRRNYLPSLVKKRKRLLYYNFIACESHRERLLYMLNKLMK